MVKKSTRTTAKKSKKAVPFSAESKEYKELLAEAVQAIKEFESKAGMSLNDIHNLDFDDNGNWVVRKTDEDL